MKSLGKTIDRLIKIDPSLEDHLVPIKDKWKRYPSRTLNYWKELIEFLNSESLLNHPKRSEIRNVVVPKRCVNRKQLYSFEELTPNDKVLGIIPENLSDLIKRHDRQTIKTAKLRMEANFTKNKDLMTQASRIESQLDLKTKKLWITLKDYFNLWEKPAANYNIKKDKNGLLIFVEQIPGITPTFLGPGIVKMDYNTLRQFMQFLGMDPPPDLPELPSP